jgi:hypothetical protein
MCIHTVIMMLIRKKKFARRLNCSNKFLGIKFKIVYFDVLIELFEYLAVFNKRVYSSGFELLMKTVRNSSRLC